MTNVESAAAGEGSTAMVVVWGVRAHWARDLPEPVRVQLRLAHDLREDLVSVYCRYQEALAAIWSAFPDIAELEERMSALDARAEELSSAASRERSAARSRKVDSPVTRALAEVRAEVRTVRARRRERIAAVRADAGDRIVAVAERERAEVKALYKRFCQDGVDTTSGVVRLYWATYNDVVGHHKVACAALKAARAGGRPAQLRHHRFDGTGSIAVQLQRCAGQPARSPELLSSGVGPWRNVLELDQWPRGSVRMRVGTGVEAAHVVVPVTVHRRLPAAGEVPLARLVVRRTAGHLKAAVHVTVLQPSVRGRAPEGRPTVAVHLGWRNEGELGVRVATWRSTAPVTVPETLRDVVVSLTDRTGIVRLPVAWRETLVRADELRGIRDRQLDWIKAALVEHLRVRPPADGDGWPAAEDVARWRSAARLAGLTLRHREDPPAGREAMTAALEEWRRGDRRRWETEAHRRAKLLRRRNDAYARVAAWVVGFADRIVVEDTALPRLARREPPSVDSVPTFLVDAAASQRTHAAPGCLRLRVSVTAAREGVSVRVVSHAGITRTHYRCGFVNAADADYTRRVVVCAGCGQGYDQDASATLMLLAASGEAPAPGVGTACVTC